MLRLLARRHHQLVAGRTRAICRLHAVLAELIEGGLAPNLSADKAVLVLRRFRPSDAIGIARKQLAVEFLTRPVVMTGRWSSSTSASTVAVWAGGHLGDRRAWRRCRSSRATCSATPVTSPGSRPRATTPVTTRPHRSRPHPARGAAPLEPEREPPAEPRDPHRGARPDLTRHTRPRLLPRQTSRREVPQRSDAVPETTDQRCRLPPPARRHRPAETETGSGRTIRGDSESSAAGKSLNTGTSERSLPNPNQTLEPLNPSCHGPTPTRPTTAHKPAP